MLLHGRRALSAHPLCDAGQLGKIIQVPFRGRSLGVWWWRLGGGWRGEGCLVWLPLRGRAVGPGRHSLRLGPCRPSPRPCFLRCPARCVTRARPGAGFRRLFVASTAPWNEAVWVFFRSLFRKLYLPPPAASKIVYFLLKLVPVIIQLLQLEGIFFGWWVGFVCLFLFFSRLHNHKLK